MTWKNNTPESFWSRATRGDGCWEWQGGRDRDGYGKVSYKKKDHQAHRLAWELTYGAPPADQCVCHRCDNRRCVRPDHLFLGSHRDNYLDAISKGRPMSKLRSGGQHHKSKISVEKARQIKARVAAGESQKSIAADMGVSTQTVFIVLSGKHWTDRQGVQS